MASSYQLGKGLELFIKELVSTGRYNSKSEVVREGLRLLQEHEQVREIKLEEIRRAFQEGINSGKGNDADEFFDRLETKYIRMSDNK